MDAGHVSVVVEVDRPRELRIDLNILCDVEKATGLNLLLDPQATLSLTGLRALCWCSWKRTDPTLTMDQAGLIVGEHLAKVLKTVTSVMAASYSMKGDEEETANPPTAPPIG